MKKKPSNLWIKARFILGFSLLITPEIDVAYGQISTPGTGNLAPVQEKKSLKAQAYTHPTRNFSLIFPPGSNVEIQKKGDLLTYRSRKGYLVKVQTGSSNFGVPLTAMSSRLERLYLGKGKPWQTRGKDIKLTVAGLPAHKVIYEGANTRSSVIFIRGQKTDFVFMFFAPRDRYEDLKPGFEWIIGNFQPDSGERSALKIVKKSITLPEKNNKREPKKSLEFISFQDDKLGFSIDYLKNWAVTKTSAMAIFSGKPGVPEYAVLIGVQNLEMTDAKDPSKAALKNIKIDLARQTSGLTIFKEGQIKTSETSGGLVGKSFIAKYRYQNQGFKKWVVAVARKNSNIVHVWSYTAPTFEFDQFQNVAQRMLNSWRLSGAR